MTNRTVQVTHDRYGIRAWKEDVDIRLFKDGDSAHTEFWDISCDDRGVEIPYEIAEILGIVPEFGKKITVEVKR